MRMISFFDKSKTLSMAASDMPRCERIEKRADPTMMHTYIGDRYERSQRPGDMSIGDDID